jgi:hypothetical protein
MNENQDTKLKKILRVAEFVCVEEVLHTDVPQQHWKYSYFPVLSTLVRRGYEAWKADRSRQPQAPVEKGRQLF